MKKLLFFAVLLLGNTLLESCYGCKDPGCYDLGFSRIDNYNFRDTTILQPLDTVLINDFALAPIAISEDTKCAMNVNFGGSLLAQEDCDVAKFANEIINISIVSDSDLSENITAGKELKDFFQLMNIRYGCLNNGTRTVEECLQGYDQIDDSPERTFNRRFAYGFHINPDQDIFSTKNLLVWAAEKDINPSLYSFTVTFEFEDGKVIELKSDPIFLK